MLENDCLVSSFVERSQLRHLRNCRFEAFEVVMKSFMLIASMAFARCVRVVRTRSGQAQSH